MALWTWPTGAPADPYRALPVFTLTPNWKGGVLERLEWATDLMSSEIAVEQRRGSRRFPRRSFEAGFMRVDQDRAKLDNFLAGIGRGVFLVPLWHEQVRLGEPLGTDGVVPLPAGTLAAREFHVGDLVLLQGGDLDRNVILTVMATNLATDRITLAAASNAGTWAPGSRITPLRRARNLEQAALAGHSSRVGSTQIRFNLTDADSRFEASWGYCAPLWRFKPNRATEIGTTFDRSAFVLDMGGGVVEVVDPGNRAQIGTSMQLSLFGREAVAKFRAFLYMARGRARRFYLPSYADDLHAVEDLGGPTFDARRNGFADFQAVPQEARRIISVEFKDGRPTIYRNITGIDRVLSPVAPFHQVAERFTVEPDMPPVLQREIERMSFVMPVRFDQDAFEIAHVTDDSAAVTAAVVTKSSVVEGMPPIECWVTSLPYPLVVEDALSAALTVSDGLLATGLHNAFSTEDLEANISIADGTLRTILRSTTMPTDAMEAGLTASDGELRQILRSTVAPEESLQAGMTVADGTIKAILIRHSIAAEGLAASLTVGEGTLS